MRGQIQRAVLLAAGFGTRMRPLTITTPKSLLPLDGALLIDHQLKYLADAHISEIVINLHHLGEMIRSHVGDGARYGLSVAYSVEPEILGTGGGIKKAALIPGVGPWLALNADALIDADISRLVERHSTSGAAATMVVKELSDGDSYKPVFVDESGMVARFGEGRHFYTGLQVIGQRMLDALPPAGTPSCLIKDGYKKLLAAREPVSAFIHRGYFNDLGTPDRYEAAKRDIASGAIHIFRK